MTKYDYGWNVGRVLGLIFFIRSNNIMSLHIIYNTHIILAAKASVVPCSGDFLIECNVYLKFGIIYSNSVYSKTIMYKSEM